jgi:hypothetical protein
MAREARTFERVTEAEMIIQKIKEQQPDLLWAVDPEIVAVMGVDNQERTEKAIKKNAYYSKFRVIKGSEKKLFAENKIPVRYIVEIYWSDWHRWTETERQWVLLNEILKITPDVEKVNSPDCSGFKVLLDVVGVNWDKDQGKELPDLLSSDVSFNLDLRPGLDDLEDEEDD